MRSLYLWGLWIAGIGACFARSSSPDERWKVDGVALGESAERIGVSHRLVADRTLPGWLSWTSDSGGYLCGRLQVESTHGVVEIFGKELTRGAQVLLQEGDPVSQARRLFGEPRSESGMLGGCLEDPYLYWNYRLAWGDLSVLVSNDEFLRRRGQDRRALGRVWRVRLSHVDYRKLLEESLQRSR